ncbi:MAG: histidine phosphatase family protein [Anaerolineae bacterium]
MKTVLMLRHAKSDWGTPNLADFDRPLAKRGLEDAPQMGQVLARFKTVPQRILASPAKRAQQTAEMVAQACGYKDSIQWEESFYEGGSADLVEALRRLPANLERVLLIGHNPILEETVLSLCAPEVDSVLIRIPTAGLVCLNFEMAAWADLKEGEGVLQWFVIPKLVKALQNG